MVLLVDGNWAMMSRVFIMKKKFNPKLPKSSLEAAENELINFLAQSVSGMMWKDLNITNIIIMGDGGSWRKRLTPPSSISDVVYKGQRVKDSEMDWDHIFHAFSTFLENCKKYGFTVCKEGEIEGDDWMWWWSKKLNEQGESCMIWSADQDLQQLVKTTDKAYTCWYNSKKLVLDQAINEKEEIDLLDMFMNGQNLIKDELNHLSKKIGIVEHINPASIVSSKVIMGDMGDNIQSCATIEQNGRMYKVSKKIYEKLDCGDTVEEFVDNFEQIANTIPSCSPKFTNYNVTNIEEMLKYNLRMVWISEKTLPEDILEKMKSIEYKTPNLKSFMQNYKVMNTLSKPAFIDLPF